MSKRYKLEVEIYGDEKGIDHLKAEICSFIVNTIYNFDNFSCEKYQSDFNPSKFMKMCKELEERYYNRTKTNE